MDRTNAIFDHTECLDSKNNDTHTARERERARETHANMELFVQ